MKVAVLVENVNSVAANSDQVQERMAAWVAPAHANVVLLTLDIEALCPSVP